MGATGKIVSVAAPESAKAGSTVTITVNFQNVGDATGQFQVGVSTPDGKTKFLLPQTLSAGAKGSVSLTATMPSADYNGTAFLYLRDPTTGALTEHDRRTFTVKWLAHLLTVDSEPSGIKFTINDVQASTPYSATLQEGDYTITMPAEWNGWRFKQWENGSTNPVRSITLTADTSMKATYERAIIPALPPTITIPIVNVEVPIEYVVVGGIIVAVIFGGAILYLATAR
jgi:hypothetical protein